MFAIFLTWTGVATIARAGSGPREARVRFDRGAELESKAAELLKAGDREQAEARLAEALVAYHEALAKAPADPDAALRIGTILHFKARCDEALPMLVRSARLAFDVDLSDPTAVEATDLQGRPKLRELLLLFGKCRLADRPDEAGFRILEAIGDLAPDVHFLVGRRYLEAGRHRPALAHLSTYLETRADDHKVRRAVANLQLRLDLLSEAADSYRAVLAQRPDDLPALKNLAVVQVRQARYRLAVNTLQRVLEQVPNDVPARFNLGVCLARVGDHARAVTQLKKALDLKPQLARAWHRLGLSLFALKRPSEGLDALSAAIRHAPTYVPSYLALARTHRLAGRAGACASVLRRGLEQKPEEPRMLVGLGDCLREQGRAAAALEMHLTAARVAPADASVHAALGDDYRSLGRLEDAVAAYRKALDTEKETSASVRPALANALGELGTRSLRRREVKPAMRWLEEAVSLRPTAAVHLANLGLARLAAGRERSAEKALARAHRLSPNHPGIRTALGRLRLNQGRAQDAVRTLAPATATNPTAGALHLLGLAHLRNGQATKAAKSLQRALALRLTDPRIRFDLGRALVHDRRYKEAWSILAPLEPPASSPEAATFVLVRAYAAYRAGDYEGATRVLARAGLPSGELTDLRAAAWLHLGRELARRRQLRVALSAFRTARDFDDGIAARANTAAIEYQLGQPRRAYRTWKSLVRRKALPELYYNVAIYFDDEAGNESAAYAWYRKFARRLPETQRSDARALVARKRALFGFKP